MNGAEASSKDVILLMSKLICICVTHGNAQHTNALICAALIYATRTVHETDSSAYFIAAVETCKQKHVTC